MDALASIMNVVTQTFGQFMGVQYDTTINIKDVATLQRFVGFYAGHGVISIENRTALENALVTPSLKEWARGLPAEAVSRQA